MICLILSVKRIFTKVSKDITAYFIFPEFIATLVTLGVRIISRSEFEHIDSIAHCARSTETELQHYNQTQ